MTELRTPDALSTQHENALICERLLGYVPCKHPECVGWFHYDGKRCVCGPRQKPHLRTRELPSFTTWAEAGLILEEMAARGYSPKVGVAVPGKWYGVNPLGEASYAATGPLAVRAAALEYIKAAT